MDAPVAAVVGPANADDDDDADGLGGVGHHQSSSAVHRVQRHRRRSGVVASAYGDGEGGGQPLRWTIDRRSRWWPVGRPMVRHWAFGWATHRPDRRRRQMARTCAVGRATDGAA